MVVTKIAGQWYLAVAAVALFGAHTLTAWDVLPGLLLTLALWLVFTVGTTGPSPVPRQLLSPSIESKLARAFPFLAAISVASSIVMINFYTGQSIDSVVSDLNQGSSLYQSYQQHFLEEDLTTFSWRKIPPIMGGAILKFTLIALFMKTIVVESRLSPRYAVSLIAVIASYLLYSFSKGTSLEIFELFVLVWFSMALRRRYHEKSRFPGLAMPAVVLGGVLLLYAFNYNIGARTGEHTRECLTAGICRNEEAILYGISPLLGDISFSVTTYAAFGVHFASKFVTDYLFASPELLFASGVPFGFHFYGSDPVGSICGDIIDCGAAWIPDMILYTRMFGFVSFVFGVLLLGRLVRYLLSLLSVKMDTVTLMVLFFAALALLSLPVGNFIIVSSSNQLALCATVAIFVIGRRRPSTDEYVTNCSYLTGGSRVGGSG